MPEEKTTPEQIVDASNYHSRDYSLRELALSNFLEKHLSNQSDLANCEWGGIFNGILSGSGGGTASNIKLIGVVGEDTSAPSAEFQLGVGEYFRRIAADGAFTGKFNGGICENNVLLVFGEAEEIQKYDVDGDVLEQKNTGGAEDLNCAAFGGGVFLIAGNDGKLLKSDDNGESWDDKSAAINTGNDLIAITYFNNRFVAIDGDEFYYYSNDLGESWIKAAFPSLPGFAELEADGMINDGEQLIVFGEHEGVPYDVPVIARSTNGISWEAEPFVSDWPYPNEPDFESGAYKNGVHVIVGEGLAFYSYDGGQTWQSRFTPLRWGERVTPGIGNEFWIVGDRNTHVSWGVYSSQRLY